MISNFFISTSSPFGMSPSNVIQVQFRHFFGGFLYFIIILCCLDHFMYTFTKKGLCTQDNSIPPQEEEIFLPAENYHNKIIEQSLLILFRHTGNCKV